MSTYTLSERDAWGFFDNPQATPQYKYAPTQELRTTLSQQYDPLIEKSKELKKTFSNQAVAQGLFSPSGKYNYQNDPKGHVFDGDYLIYAINSGLFPKEITDLAVARAKNVYTGFVPPAVAEPAKPVQYEYTPPPVLTNEQKAAQQLNTFKSNYDKGSLTQTDVQKLFPEYKTAFEARITDDKRLYSDFLGRELTPEERASAKVVTDQLTGQPSTVAFIPNIREFPDKPSTYELLGAMGVDPKTAQFNAVGGMLEVYPFAENKVKTQGMDATNLRINLGFSNVYAREDVNRTTPIEKAHSYNTDFYNTTTKFDSPLAAKSAALDSLSDQDVRTNLFRELSQQRDTLRDAGLTWKGNIPDDQALTMMVAQLEKSGVKSLADIKQAENGAVINARTGNPLTADYAFADASSGGRTWSGTFAGEGSTRFNVDFANGVPIFSTQGQATVKSGLEKMAPALAGIGATFVLGPAGLSLLSAPAAAIAGGAISGLAQRGEITDALKGAVLASIPLGVEAAVGFAVGSAQNNLISSVVSTAVNKGSVTDALTGAVLNEIGSKLGQTIKTVMPEGTPASVTNAITAGLMAEVTGQKVSDAIVMSAAKDLLKPTPGVYKTPVMPDEFGGVAREIIDSGNAGKDFYDEAAKTEARQALLDAGFSTEDATRLSGDAAKAPDLTKFIETNRPVTEVTTGGAKPGTTPITITEEGAVKPETPSQIVPIQNLPGSAYTGEEIKAFSDEAQKISNDVFEGLKEAFDDIDPKTLKLAAEYAVMSPEELGGDMPQRSLAEVLDEQDPKLSLIHI